MCSCGKCIAKGKTNFDPDGTSSTQVRESIYSPFRQKHKSLPNTPFQNIRCSSPSLLYIYLDAF
jgi:hypothetical protein